MEPPPSKRLRRMPCYCPACRGCERDMRTVQRHQGGYSLPIPDVTNSGGSHQPITAVHIEDEDNTHFDVSANTSVASSSVEEHFSLDPILTHYVIDEARIKLARGHSQAELEEHLRNASKLNSKIPQSWPDVLKLMKELGYQNPKHYKVCIDQDHSFLLESAKKHPRCGVCGKVWKNCMDYYVLGLNFDTWFLSEERCAKLMSHWDDRDTWLDLPVESEPTNQTELWHGARFRELSCFWNPDAVTLLPEKCSHCSAIIPVQQIIGVNASTAHDTELIELVCSECNSKCRFLPRRVNGDPRNQAILIHEDGWAPHSTSARHSTAALTITHGCMTKQSRASGTNARVFSFIPVCDLPRHAPHKFDAFLQPLFEELEELYIEGQEVFFKAPVPGHSPAQDTSILRVIPLLATADMKAHAEIGLTAAGGRKGCRRCELVGEYVPERRHYYYGNFLRRYRFPPPLRSSEDSRAHGVEVDAASSDSQRKCLVKEHGVTGVSLFYRLYDLCGFSPVQDLVVDSMHAIGLNLVRTELEYHLLLDLGSNKSCNVSERSPQAGGLLDRDDLAIALGHVPWTTELRDGRVPSVSPHHPDAASKHRLGHWKCEEFMKFALVAPYVLHSIIPRPAYDCFLLLHRIYQLVFSHYMRIEGWRADDRKLLEDLVFLHAICFENLYGTSACTENLEYCRHLPEDIYRHSSPDNYWCFMYERLVSFYKQQTTNQKNLCKTFADRAAQLAFVDEYLELHPLPSCRHESSAFSSLSTSAEPVVLAERTLDSALTLKEYITANEERLPEAVIQHYRSGILLGAPSFTLLTEQQLADVKFWLEKGGHMPSQLPSTVVAQGYHRLLKSNELNMATTYRVGETIVIRDTEVPGREWVMKVSQFILYGPVEGEYHVFVNGTYYIAKTRHGQVEVDDWTKQPKMIPRNYHRHLLQPSSSIDRKVMLYPEPSNQDNPSFYLVIDPDRVDFSSVRVPHYPLNDEIVEVKTPSACVLVKIDCVDSTAMTASGTQLRRVGRTPPRWCETPTVITVQLSQITQTVNLRQSGNCYYSLTPSTA